ncbi:hypothetical protein K439DRAFT_1624060 [Ramaria rubella]|nr:hypothetical protein K439DRAFT_1624060 [Ramaria rubella]
MVIFIDNLPHIQAAARVSMQTALASVWSIVPGLERVKTELLLVKDGKMYNHKAAVELLDAHPKIQVERAEGDNTLKETYGFLGQILQTASGGLFPPSTSTSMSQGRTPRVYQGQRL